MIKLKLSLRNLSEKEINDYVESGEPLDKAGAYGIQECGGAFVESVLRVVFQMWSVCQKSC